MTENPTPTAEIDEPLSESASRLLSLVLNYGEACRAAAQNCACSTTDHSAEALATFKQIIAAVRVTPPEGGTDA